MTNKPPSAALSRPEAMVGLRVLLLGNCAAAGFCTQLMAQLGAEVQMLETDSAAVPFDGDAVQAQWFGLHAGADTAATEAVDVATLEAALARADVLIDARAADAASVTTLDPDALRNRFPRLVSCRLTPFGSDGPYRDFHASDITLYAMSGLMQTTGDGTREPLNARPRIAQISAGLYAAIGCLMALRRREISGSGDRVELSMQEAAMQNAEIALAEQLHGGKVARRNGDEHALVPWRSYRCADGEAFICGGPARNWRNAVALIDDEALGAQPFDRLHERLQHRVAFENHLRTWLQNRARADLFHAGQRCGLAWAPLLSLHEVADDAQHRARDFFREVVLPDGRRGRQPAAPFRQRAENGDAPPASPSPPDAAQRAPATWTPQLPLAGLRVVDFTHDWAGPHAARLLADQGAEVIKIEYRTRLDGMRGGYPERVDGFARFWQLHRNKRSVTLDLKQPEEFALCQRLIADSDLVIENSRPGVMQRLGLGFEALRALRDDIIMISMSAFGASGPYADYAGYGGGIEAVSGLQSLTGYADDGPRYRVREMDVINGAFGALAASAALLHRERGGKGQWIDLSETETCCWAIGEYFAQASDNGSAPAVVGNRHTIYAPQGCYPCAGDDRWITLSVTNDRQWHALVDLIGAREWADDAALECAEQRRAAHDVIDARIAQWSAQQAPSDAMHSLQSAGIAAGMVMTAADLTDDPHLAARTWHCDIDGLRLPGGPFRFANGGGQLWRRGPDLGQDNDWLTARYSSPDDRTLETGCLGTAFDN